MGVTRRALLRRAGLLAGTLACAPAFSGARAGAPRRGGRARISMRVPDLRRPHTFSWVYDSNAVRQANDYLTRTGADNVTRPALLERWEASRDLAHWTLHLRPGVRWSSGEPLVAEHVAWNIRRWLDPAVGSSMRGLMGSYLLGPPGAEGGQALWRPDAIEILDDQSLALHLRHPQIALPEHLFHYAAAILHPGDGGEWGVGARGTGAFEPVEIEVGKRIRLRRRESYWGEGPWLDEILFVDHGDDPAAALAAIASGQVDGLYEASTLQYRALQAMPRLALHTVRSAQTAVARMQPRHKPFDDPRVRRAMRLALDTDALLLIGHLGLGDAGEHHHVAPVHPDYVPLAPMRRDLAQARRLLAEAGYPDGFSTEIACKKDPAWELICVQAMVQMWREAGVRVAIRVMPSTQYWDIWTEAPFAFTPWTHRPRAIMTLALAYRSDAPWNESRWSDPRLDALLTEAEGTADEARRRALMAEIERLMQEEGPICQPLWRTVFTPMDKRLQGFRLHPSYYLFGEEWWWEEA